ncbi:hypothetical protein TanjilG_05042 [Lupinus angustifolius]|uniref:TIR domain-containing protein n=1 Tax=Lupinus angustifolius TaxID=3871 RepID=A0A4P1R550_LUPAN|nr:hypothetical protein TanjilG_05042 [Lupinus angustifolius]
MSLGESSLQWKYHVFLSFRGGDTRLSFTNHLYAALVRKGIITFRDDKQLHKGDAISQHLHQSIQQSLAAIVVISENYASSTWCLDELKLILESRIDVFPVFYGVTPSDVRYQKNSFAEAFNKHVVRFEQDEEKVQKWRDCLKEVADFSGWESKDMAEAELIEDVIEKVWIKLQPKLPSYNEGVVGFDSRVKKMISLLSIGSQDIRFIGIWGMAGTGKTILARVIYETISSQFEIKCFLLNVREVSQTSDGLVSLQRKLLSTLKISNLEIDDLYDGKKKIMNLLCNKSVLLVLDDISHLSQLENLAKTKGWFGPCSRVIITTKDMHLLVSHGACEKYEMRILNESSSFQLFSQKAFRRDKPPEGYLEITKSMVKYAGGLPLALKVLGSFVCGRSLSQWKDALDKIKQVLPKDILNTLIIGYDGLEDAEKTLFLDIAFFFTGRSKIEVIQVLADCGLNPTIGISLLIERSLVSCCGGILEMHDLLQEMGRNIVYQESPDDASRRSRLCSLEDINRVFRKNKGTNIIQGIVLKSSDPCEAYWHPEAFSKMDNLRVLIILCDLHLPLGLKCLSSSLKLLEWKGYPLEYLPFGLQLLELVHLKMHCSKLKQLWNGTQIFRELKSIDLSDSRDLIQTPDISEVPCLESLVLKGCKNLVEVHQSVAKHKNVAILDLEGCISLKTLPRKLEMNALEKFILSGCSQIKNLPEFGESMECLSMLNLRDCTSLVSLPQSVRNMKSFRDLNIHGCSKLFKLTNNSNENNVVEEIDETETGRREVHSSAIDLKSLNMLLNKGYDWLITNSWSFSLLTEKVFDFVKYPVSMDSKLPSLSSFPRLKKLDMGNCNLSDGPIIDHIGHLTSLEVLYLAGNNFVDLTASIGNLSRLQRLGLYKCRRLRTLPELPPSVCQLLMNDCTQLEPMLFDTQIILKIFEANRWSLTRELWFLIPGSEIPAWFEHQDYFSLKPSLAPFDYHEEYAFIVSTIVNIPDYCLSSDWIGIIVCFLLESGLKADLHRHIRRSPVTIGWSFKDPDAETVYPLRFTKRRWTHFKGNHLLITTFGSDHRIYKHYLTCGKSKVQLIFCGENICKCGKLKLKNCGIRVICKEDGVSRRGEETSEVEVPSTSVESDVHKQSRITEITDEYE